MTLDAVPTAAGEARRLLSEVCQRSALPGRLRDDAVLLVSELVTNVVIHGGHKAQVSVSTTRERVRVDVFDAGDQRPLMPAYDPLAEHGRGLMLLSACATRWGVRHDGPGKTVWFEIHSPQAPFRGEG